MAAASEATDMYRNRMSTTAHTRTATPVAAGRSTPNTPAAVATAFAEPAIRLLRTCFDLDRDGRAAILGGGDCDDFDAAIHPGAVDWPDDGVDADCSGSDATTTVAVRSPLGELPASVPREMNLLLLTVDTVRADHCGFYGYSRPTTPALDQLAAVGSVFEQGYAHAPSTRSSAREP